jgi:hypothetical protein
MMMLSKFGIFKLVLLPMQVAATIMGLLHRLEEEVDRPSRRKLERPNEVYFDSLKRRMTQKMSLLLRRRRRQQITIC